MLTLTEDSPKLSVTLTGPRDPVHCQSCGAQGSLYGADEIGSLSLTRWRECNEFDRPTGTIIILCKPCEDRIIEPHPRLYEALPQFEPLPGVMPVCAECPFQHHLRCGHPKLKRNGGEGLNLIMPRPLTAHVLYSRSINGRRGGWLTMYHGPVHCTERNSEVTPSIEKQ